MYVIKRGIIKFIQDGVNHEFILFFFKWDIEMEHGKMFIQIGLPLESRNFAMDSIWILWIQYTNGFHFFETILQIIFFDYL